MSSLTSGFSRLSARDLAALDGLFGELEELLNRERAAVRVLDHSEVESTARGKQRIFEHIARIVGAGVSGVELARSDGAGALSGRLRERAERVHALAWANASLLADALAAVRDMLGVGANLHGYDRHGGGVRSARIHGTRAV